MSGMTGILGGWTRHLAAAALIVVLCSACGRLDSNIPSDGEMIEVFKTKEKTFSEIVELFQEFPSWEGHHPREQVYHNGYWPEDAESRSFFGEERALKIDSLLQVIGCENVHFRYSYSYYPTENICPVEYSFTYNARGLSIGPSIGRSFIYSTNPKDSAAITSEIGYEDFKPVTYFMAEGDLDSLYYDIRNKAMENEESILHILLRRRIADNWLINLQYFD